MPLSPDQAAETLRDIESTQARSRELQGYRKGGAHFVLWGAVWIIGYGLTGLLPRQAGLAWSALVVGGIVGSALLAGGTRAPGGWRY